MVLDLFEWEEMAWVGGGLAFEGSSVRIIWFLNVAKKRRVAADSVPHHFYVYIRVIYDTTQRASLTLARRVWAYLTSRV